MEIVLILICVFIIVGLTYLGAGAWLRDRERTRRGPDDRRPPRD